MTEAAAILGRRQPRLLTRPMRHQMAAFDKMLPSRVGALFMDMGTGKSLVVLMLAIHRWHKISNVVWCCPVSLMRNTERQILMHSDTPPERIFRFDSKVTDKTLPDADWYIVGLESIGGSDRVALAFNALVDERTMLVVDESSYIKGHRAKRTRRLQLIGARARYRLVLNGTPISQGIEDLYAQMTFLSEQILGYRSWYSFQRAHIEWSERYWGKIDERKGVDKLSQRMAPYVYQVTKDECLDIPDKLPPSSRYVRLTHEQELLYEQAKERFARDLLEMEYNDPADTGIVVYRLFGALQAIANGVIPAGFKGHGQAIDTRKLDEVEALARQLRHEHLVIWCRYQATVLQVEARLKSALPDMPTSLYYGALNERQRDQNLTAWRENGGALVATASSGGYGLDLVEASYAIFVSNSFKYSERLQAEDRMHRIGQTRSPTYVDIWAECGIEVRIEGALRSKGDALQAFRQELEIARHQGRGAVEEVLRSL